MMCNSYLFKLIVFKDENYKKLDRFEIIIIYYAACLSYPSYIIQSLWYMYIQYNNTKYLYICNGNVYIGSVNNIGAGDERKSY